MTGQAEPDDSVPIPMHRPRTSVGQRWKSVGRMLDQRRLRDEDRMNDLGKTSQYRLTAAKTAEDADGRKHRSQKSQILIVNAMLELVAQGLSLIHISEPTR